ncbi:siderophore synthetase [Clostridium folliculivorans]|uniref:Siderophore synthetase n=1 Tax=Clostridium folliculivorans TaxID=2886038 RepID=A0A9W5Y0U8_9CLOT|nr:siderophore synthetase [Clostridium folliculivorans]GKU24506.1 siderophore synthetase [Clostridium folliculivorans]GKU30604.1 siderophore synthetase [Clostridium folliculivorans]
MRFKSEAFDVFQFLSEEYKYNDHQLHCVLQFKGKVEEKILERAINLSFKAIPILSSKYVEDTKRPYWESCDFKEVNDYLIVTKDKSSFDDFIVIPTNEFNGPQVRFCLYGGTICMLAVIMNHMICDAAGFKQYIYLLSDLYSKLYKDNNYVLDKKINGTRSINIITDNISSFTKMKILTSRKIVSNKTGHLKFPISHNSDKKPFIKKYIISKDRYIKIKDYCQKNNFTINDVFLAAYYRVMFNILKVKHNDKLNIAIMIDMRRHLKNKTIDSLCNLASSVVTGIEYCEKDNFFETACKVKNDVDLKKNSYFGMKGFLEIELAFKILSYKTIKKLLKKHFNNPVIGMTNIGILDKRKLKFGNTEVEQAFMCGSIKYAPYFQLALSSFDDTVTLTVNLFGDMNDQVTVNDFLLQIVDELP